MILFGIWRICRSVANAIRFHRMRCLDEDDVRQRCCETFGLCRRIEQNHHDRRLRQKMKDPEFREAFERELQRIKATARAWYESGREP